MPSRANSSKSNTGAWLTLVCIGVVSLVAIGSVLKVRVETGETYPFYSSLRSDPLGTRALYEALEKQPGVKAERNYMPVDRLKGEARTTLVIPGMTARAFNSAYLMDTLAVSRFAIDGGRVVIALNPEGYDGRLDRAFRDAVREVEEGEKKDRKDKKDAKDAGGKALPQKKAEDDAKPKAAPKAKKTPSKKKGKTEDDEKNLRNVREEKPAFAEVLRIAPKAKDWFRSREQEGSEIEPKAAAPLKVEDCPRWMSNVFLDDDPTQNWHGEPEDLSRYAEKKKLNEQGDGKAESTVKNEPEVQPSPWKVIAAKGIRPMIAERRLGAGSVVVCTDRYFLSNEALWKNPKPVFLSWLIGDATKVIFEETHLGAMVGDDEGIMTLVRRHGMEGLFLGGLLLFGLFVWRSAVSLVPSNADDDLGHWRADAVEGRSSASGLEGLMRRGFTTKGLLKRCFDVWSGTRAAVTAVPADRLQKARAIVDDPASAKNVATAYRAVRDALHPPR